MPSRRPRPSAPSASVYVAADHGLDVGAKYAVVCDAHGNMVGVRSRALAEATARDPSEFCEDCRAPARRNPSSARAHPPIAATPDCFAESRVRCHECRGSGRGIPYGQCHRCRGAGNVDVVGCKLVVHPRAVALQRLRDIYAATSKPTAGTSALDLAGEDGWDIIDELPVLMIALLAHGAEKDAAKVIAAFSELPGGAGFRKRLVMGPTEFLAWSHYPGNAQRFILDAQRLILVPGQQPAPWTIGVKNKMIRVNDFRFND